MVLQNRSLDVFHSYHCCQLLRKPNCGGQNRIRQTLWNSRHRCPWRSPFRVCWRAGRRIRCYHHHPFRRGSQHTWAMVMIAVDRHPVSSTNARMPVKLLESVKLQKHCCICGVEVVDVCSCFLLCASFFRFFVEEGFSATCFWVLGYPAFVPFPCHRDFVMCGFFVLLA